MKWACLSLFLLLGSPDFADTSGRKRAERGIIRGRVIFRGNANFRRCPGMAIDGCCGIHPAAIIRPEKVLIQRGRIRNVLVYVKGRVKGNHKPVRSVRLQQKGGRYEPHVLAVMKGQKIIAVNGEDHCYNVHILPRLNPENNFCQPGKGSSRRFSFRIPEIGIKVKDDIHPWMSATIHVLRHPYYAVTPENGEFVIRGLPPGEYTLAAWHETFGEKTKRVRIGSTREISVEFTYGEPK